MASVANILLEVLGDSDDAQRALEEVSAELAVFGRQTAEADADIDTDGAQANLDALKARLAAFSATDVTADVNVRIAEAQAELAVLQAELSRIDGDDVNVDVNVRQGVVSRIRSLTRQVDGLQTSLANASEGSSTLGSFLSALIPSAGVLKGALLAVAVVLASSLVAALAAMVASLAEALAGVGALAVALGAALVPGAVLAIGALVRFAATAEEAGTAAYALVEAGEEFGEVFKEATAEGADAVFAGIADALGEIAPVVDKLGPAFTRLGEAGGDAFRELGKFFGSSDWTQFFRFTASALEKLTPLFMRSFGAFSKVLANIAEASMPFLIRGFERLAEGLENLAAKTSDIAELRKDIGGLVDQLRAWLRLMRGIGDAFVAFTEAVSGQGQEFVEWLTAGTEAFADWTRSDEGRERIRQFFDDVLPLAKSTIELVVRFGVVFLQAVQLVSPAVKKVVDLFNDVLVGVSAALDYIQKNAPWAVAALRTVVLPITTIIDEWDELVGLVASPLEFILNFQDDVQERARKIWHGVKGVVEDGIKFILQFQKDVQTRARKIWQGVRDKITDGIRFVLSFQQDVQNRARKIWSGVKGVISDAINFIFSLPSDVGSRARGIWETVKGIISDTINFVLGIASGILDKARSIWSDVKGILGKVITIPLKFDLPNLPDIPGLATGVRDLARDGLHRVGEMGEELVWLPQGADVYTANETRKILRALAGGARGQNVAAAPALSGGASRGDTNYYLTVQAPSSGTADPEATLALLTAKLRARGGFPV